MNEFGYVYLIINNINNKKYVGQSINFKRRIREHIRNADNNKNHPLYYAINKYGLKNFEFKIIDTANTFDELNNKEIQYILQYKSNNREFGYNLEFGGKNSSPNIETVKKMSESHLGTKQTKEWVNKRVSAVGTNDAKKYGKFKTEEEKYQFSINSSKYWLGKNRDNKTKEKISKTKKNKLSETQKEIVCKVVYKIDSITNKILKIFESTVKASKTENVNQSTISRWCSKNKIIDNILWRY